MEVKEMEVKEMLDVEGDVGWNFYGEAYFGKSF